ncbi:MAG: MOSC domain-containing protein [Microbacterium sp.]|uniref:MOSC domain-containing protein n=1 Tax=Microbacterium sp. TaxID=51671 RepID=UPI0026387A2F|nr:MOSC domain-containing protein [Microbacterium sp.]MCX6502141.1 MOSC domain-containing protein [Microbacterium sp.]
MSGRLLSVCAVGELRRDRGAVGVTAINKRPVTGPVRIGPYGVYADVQCSRKYHGGLERALYAYADEDAAFWQQELGRELPHGWFGENLRTGGIDVNAARIGERWAIGERLIVEVTSPRTACGTFARWVGGAEGRGWVARFTTAQRPGPYLRVVRSGVVAAGDVITVLSSPEDAPTIREVFAG